VTVSTFRMNEKEGGRDAGRKGEKSATLNISVSTELGRKVHLPQKAKGAGRGVERKTSGRSKGILLRLTGEEKVH